MVITAILGITILVIYALTTNAHHKHWGSIVIFFHGSSRRGLLPI
jgi:hypothetical protein